MKNNDVLSVGTETGRDVVMEFTAWSVLFGVILLGIALSSQGDVKDVVFAVLAITALVVSVAKMWWSFLKNPI